MVKQLPYHPHHPLLPVHPPSLSLAPPLADNMPEYYRPHAKSLQFTSLFQLSPPAQLNLKSDAELPLTPPCSQSSGSSCNPDSLRKNDKVSYKLKNSPTWSSDTLLQQSGKTTGMYKHSWNVLHPNQTITSIDFTHDIDDWKQIDIPSPDSDQEILLSDSFTANLEEEIYQAKQ